jgi:hypothetical protein
MFSVNNQVQPAAQAMMPSTPPPTTASGAGIFHTSPLFVPVGTPKCVA